MTNLTTRMAELDAKEKKPAAKYGLSCKTCGVVYRKKDIAFHHAWYKHFIEIYHPEKADFENLSPNDIVECSRCPRGFTRRLCSVHDYDAHILFYHTMKNDIWIPCGQCGNAFNQFDSYMNHLIGHANNLSPEQMMADMAKYSQSPQLGRKDGDKMERSLFYRSRNINQGKKSKEKSKSSTVNDFNDGPLNPVGERQANIAASKTSAPTRFQVPSFPSTGGPSRFHHSAVPRFHHSDVPRFQQSPAPRFHHSPVQRFPPPSPKTLIKRRNPFGSQF